MQNLLLIFVFLFSVLSSVKAYFACKSKSTILARPWKACEPFGSFVWADHIIIGPFWILASFFCFVLQDFTLFLLIVSVFWLIRSGGETFYWFLQQFHPRVGNEPEQFWINKHVPGEAVWFLHQIFWQCISVVALICSAFFAVSWISSLS